jgi:CheY-like chemotaxis protein/nitrogen-specific signal transduction histidine kinase
VALVGAVFERSWSHLERLRSQEQLLEADRHKDEFLATLAHELRNPLAPIRQAVQIAKSDDATAAQLRWSHDVIGRQAAHMAMLLDDLLDVARITRGQMQLRKSVVDLAAVIDTALETAKPLIESRRHRLTVSLPETPLRIEADALRLAQVVSNLLTNAAKYTDNGGDIALSVHATPSGLVIAVRDSGIGIEPQMLERVFLMFSQAIGALDRADGGLGIGLALVKGMVELHGGRIEARSAGPGHGSEFIVTLPGLALQATGEAVSPHDAGHALAAPLRIVVADDNQDAALSLKILLEIDGHQVSIAHDGEQALQVAAAIKPDIVFVDIGMPKLNGYEVAHMARTQNWGRDAILVAITGWGQPEDQQRAASAGFDHHLTNPADYDQVRSLLERLFP